MSDQYQFWDIISIIFGWTYFFCWSISFYPQPLLNWRRKSTTGVAIDFWFANCPAFLAYTASTAAFLYSPIIRSQYAFRHPSAPLSTVRFNDLAFALHAVVLSFITLSQFWPALWGFEAGKRRHATKWIQGVIYGSITAACIVAIIILAKGHDYGRDPSGWAWIDLMYAISYVKLVITIVKYLPQMFYNFKRRSTAGWSIGQIMLDFTGSILSILQLIIDSSLVGDWSGITGNPVKFILGNIGIVFNVVFILQHYVLFRDSSTENEAESEEQQPLIEAETH